MGQDTIIGNQLSNEIKSGYGEDKIFAGEGSDIIHPGPGKDLIDLSEDIAFKDSVVIENKSNEGDYDIIYGFPKKLLEIY